MAYLHTHKKIRISKLADQAQQGIYLGTEIEYLGFICGNNIEWWKPNMSHFTRHGIHVKERYIRKSKPAGTNMECVTQARKEMRLPHTRSVEMKLSANSNELEEADEVPKDIVRHTGRVQVEKGTTSVGASGSSNNLSNEHLVELHYSRRKQKVPVPSTTNVLKRVGHRDEPTTKKAIRNPETKQ